MTSVVLSTLNARYIHASLGLRYLLANMGELQAQTALAEFVINERPIDIVERLLDKEPKVIGFGVYLWNVEQTTQVVALLKQIRPSVRIVLGGPEVSHEWWEQPIVALADYLITGAADVAFAKLCRRLLDDDLPSEKIIHAEPVDLSRLSLPYRFYSDDDIAHRVLYVEASRGCPFKCEFCLSALDKTSVPFALKRFLDEMQDLYARGARRFKFVDRTFNLKIDTTLKILEFFLERLDEQLFLHFELVPDFLPEKLKAVIRKFPAGVLQFEIGIQSFNPQVQALISRKQNNVKTRENLVWLRTQSQVHLHTDLIIGLPGEPVESIAQGFNALVELDPHEIQVGILKRLRGTPIIRHTASYGIKYNPAAPYNVLCNDLVDFSAMQRLSRFARYWDLIANSGRFNSTKPLILGDDPFGRFLRLSDWLFEVTGQTHRFALPRLFELLYRGLMTLLEADGAEAQSKLWRDYQKSGLKGLPSFVSVRDTGEGGIPQHTNAKLSGMQFRQARHID